MGKPNARGSKNKGSQRLTFYVCLESIWQQTRQKNPFPSLAGIFPHHKSIVRSGLPCSFLSQKAQPAGKSTCKMQFQTERGVQEN